MSGRKTTRLEYDAACWRLFKAVKEFYDDPKNQEEFERWKEEKERAKDEK